MRRWSPLRCQNRRILKSAFAVGVVLVGLWLAWAQWLAPTRVALVNYPDFQAARIVRAKPNAFVRIDALSAANLNTIGSYDLVLVFGRGLKLEDAQLAQLRTAGFAGTPVYVDSATNPQLDVTNLKGDDLDAIAGYLRNGGRANYGEMLNFARRVFDGKPLFSKPPSAPKVMPQDVYFQIGEDAFFEDFDSFQAWQKKRPAWQAGKPRLALLTSVPGPFNSNRDHVDDVIRAFEARGFEVVPISAVQKRLAFLKEVDPAAVVYMPHGRLTLGQADEARKWLDERNIPLFAPLTIFTEEREWLADPRSYDGGLLTMSVTLPELDGAIAPLVIAAQARDPDGFKVFRALPERLERFTNLVQHTVDLKRKTNAQKKLAIYYYKGPGQSAMTAGDLEVVPSLFALLRRLRDEGYRVENLPETESEFAALLQRRGPNIGPYAKGDFATFIRDAQPATVSAAQLSQWCGSALAQVLCDQVVQTFGAAPGSYLRVEDGVAVARVPLGNVVLLPQPLPGIGADTFKVVHGTNAAPPWPYVASYLWTRNVFGADAIMHFGTHGSLEFTPWKQVGLSDRDWPDALIGDLPHSYLYTMGNVGEAMIAKRRSYATIISHLTPAFREGGAQSAYKQLNDRLQSWENAGNATLKAEYAKDVQRIAIALTLHQDVKLPQDAVWTPEQFELLEDHMETLEHAKITAGLYTLGSAYSQADQQSSARLMGVDALIQGLADLDLARGKVTRVQLDSSTYVARRYRPQADALIAAVTAGRSGHSVLAETVSVTELQRAQDWEKAKRKPDDDDLIRGFIALGASSTRGTRPATSPAAPDDEALRRNLVQAMSDPDKRAFIDALRSDQKFKQATWTLDPEALEKARTVARAIPPMAKALDVASDPDVRALLLAMQKDAVRAKVFAWLDDPDLLAKAQAAADQARTALAVRARALLPMLAMAEAGNVESIQRMNAKQLADAQAALRFWLQAPELPAELQARRSAATEKLAAMRRALDLDAAKRDERDGHFSQAVLTLRNRLQAIPSYQNLLATSPEDELAALMNALSGGYTQASSGGDPIVNPAALPTGKNLYSIDAEKTPTDQAWKLGARLADQLLAQHRAANDGAWPKKVAFTLWAGDFINTEGVAIAQVLYLLGVEPVRDPFGRVSNLRLIPRAELGRPRIDVVVQTSGQLRDLAASRLSLINKAVALAAEAQEADNAVGFGVRAVERALKDKGLSPVDAQRYAAQRVFGGANGNYGTGIMGMVESGDKWKAESEVAQTYLNNMGAVFGAGDLWGAYKPGVFAAALANTEMIVQPLESNTWGPISLDHVYEFMGGMNLAVREVTGQDPAAYFSDFRNASNPTMQEAGKAIAVEARSTLLNRGYIQAMTAGGASSAEKFAETFRNVYGWNVMKPSVIQPALWDALYETYVKDSQNLGVQKFFEQTNPYALQEMTAVMMETARKGYWKPSAAQLQAVSQLHAELVGKFGASGTEFVNDNRALRAFIAEQLGAATKSAYEDALQRVNQGDRIDSDRGMVLKRQDDALSKSTRAAESADNASPKDTKTAPSKAIWEKVAVPVGVVVTLLLAFLAAIIWTRLRHVASGLRP